MDVENSPTGAEEMVRNDSFHTSRLVDPAASNPPLVPADSPLEEGQISSSRSTPQLPPTTSCDQEMQIDSGNDTPSAPQEMVIDPHSQEPQKLDKGKAKAVDDDWATQETAVMTADQDTASTNQAGNGKGKVDDNWDSDWNSSDWATGSTASQATGMTTKEATNTAWVNTVQETPTQSITGQSTTSKSWRADDGWGSPIPTCRAAGEWGSPPPVAGPVPRSATAAKNSVAAITNTTPTLASGSTTGWSVKAPNRVRVEDRNEGGVEHGKGGGRGRGRGRDRDWSGSSRNGTRDNSSSRDRPLTNSFNQLSTSFGNSDSGWNVLLRRNNQTNQTSPTRRHWQEQSTQSAWGTSRYPPPIHQPRPQMEHQLYHSPQDPAPFQPLTPLVTARPVLWPLQTEMTLRRDFSRHMSEIAKYRVWLTEVESKQRDIHGWYNSRASSLTELHVDDHETLEQELNKARLKRDNILAALKVDEKRYTGLAEVEWGLLVRTLKDEMVRTLESGIHELLWKMSTIAGDGKKGFDINRALEEVVRTAMPRIIEGPLRRYAESIVKATEKESHKVQAVPPMGDHPMKEQSGAGQASSPDIQAILDRLSALEQENVALKASNIKLQEEIRQLETKTQEEVGSVRKEALGWTLEAQDHPVARQIREKFQTERDFILQGITSNLQQVFGAVLDRHSSEM